MQKKPKYFMDLALPRDIEPRIAEFHGVKCFNLDDVCGDCTLINANEICEIREIINSYYIQFEKWNTFHKGAKLIKRIKESTFKKVSSSLELSEISYEDGELIEQTVNKTVDILMYSLKDELSYEMLCQLEDNMNLMLRRRLVR